MKERRYPKANETVKDFTVEEETKSRGNLRKLIRSVQHIPCTRSRLDQLDQHSLGKLINELETFEPTMSSRSSVQLTKTTERKHFSRKYLNLRLYPSPERTNLKAIDSKRKFKYNCKEKDSIMASNKCQNSKNKITQDLKGKDTSYKENQQGKKNKSLYTSRNCKIVCKENKILCTSNDKQTVSNRSSPEVTEKNKVKSFKSKEEVIDSQDPENIELNRKQRSCVVKKMNFYGRKLSNCSEKIKNKTPQSPANSVSCKPKLTNKVPVMMLNSTLRRKPCPYHVLKPNQFATKIKCNKRSFSEVQPSMVKTLTSYWNNMLLSNEFEGYGSAPESFEINHSTTKSLENSVNKSSNSERNSSTSVTSQDCTESCVNVSLFRKESIENIQDLCFNDYLKKPQGKRQTLQEELDQIHKNRCSVEYMQLNSLQEQSYRAISSHQSSVEVCENHQNTPLGDTCGKTDLTPRETDPRTERVIEVLRGLILKLKQYPETSLTSNKINVSKSIKVMLCLITARVLSSKEEFYKHTEILDSQSYNEFDETMGSVSNNGKIPVVMSANSSEVTNNDMTFACSTADVFFPPIIEENTHTLAEYDSANNCSDTNENPVEMISNSSEVTGYEVSTACSTSGALFPPVIEKYEQNNNLQIVPTHGITIQKVDDALNYLKLYKECLWIKFILDPFFINTNLQNGNCQPNFKVVYEGEFIFEEASYQDEGDDRWRFEGEISEDDLDEFDYDTIIDMYKRASIIAKENICILKDLISKKLGENWTVSLPIVLKSTYHLLVSLIIFWLVMKELILK